MDSERAVDMKFSVIKIRARLQSGLDRQSKALLKVGPVVQSSLRGLMAFGLSILIVTGSVSLPGCGSQDQAEDGSDLDGVGSKLGEVLVPAAKNGTELAAFKKALVKGMASGTSKATAVKPRDQLKAVLLKAIVANNGIPRDQLKQVLTEMVDPSNAACGGANCGRLFGLKGSDVDSYLDELGDDVGKSKKLEQPGQGRARKQLLGSLRREVDEGLDISCSKA
jgi:hypothetical protein